MKAEGKRALLSSTASNNMASKESKLAEGGLKQLGFQMRIATKKNRDEFNKLKHKCSRHYPYEPQPALRICREIKYTWHAWPCKMEDCPLLKGEL